MVVCPYCEKEMSDANTKTCSSDYCFLVIDEKVYKRNTSFFDKNRRCHDCNIVNKRGNFHHFGCDMERCPKCRKQLLSCNCCAIIGKKK